MSKNENSAVYQYNKVPIKDTVDEQRLAPAHYGYGVRHIQLVILLLCMTVNFIARGHLGVTIVAMTSHAEETTATLNNNLTVHINRRNDTNIKFAGNGTEATERFNIKDTGHFILKENDDTKPFEIYDWQKSTQEMVLGSFFVGYCIMTLPMGLVTQRWGGKIPMQIALFVNGVISIAAPWLTQWGSWKAVCCCRIVQGLSQAGIYPSLQALLAKWVPTDERATLSSYVYTGTTIGTVIAFQMAGFLGASRWGWPSTFWAVGLLCLIAFAIMTIFGSASPEEHKSITEEEKYYITGRAHDGIVRRQPKVPWKAILTSKHVWGSLVTHAGSGATFVFYFTQVPSYIHYILDINVKSSGLLSSLPYIASFFTSVMFGVLSDYLTNRKIISLKTARRLSNSISQVGIAVCLVCASLTRSTVTAIFCLIMAMGCHMGVHTGWMVNHIDLAPNFSGTLMALGNTIMNILNVLMPVMVSHIIVDVKNQIQWRIMFFAVAGLTLISNAIFVVFMSSDTQPWNDIDENETIEDNKYKDKTKKKEQQ